jgi:hypothetical protein
MSDVQGLVDALALELDRPVGVDDRRYRAIAYSSHDEGADQVRLASILRREAPREVIAWLERLGVRDADRFVRVPANQAFRMEARVCVPIRFDGNLLGFLWLLDAPEMLTDAQLQESIEYADELAIALYRARILDQEGRERERELAARALGDRGAAAELVVAGHLASAPGYVVLVLRARDLDGDPPPDSIRVRLVDAAEQLRRSMAPHHMIDVVVEDGVVVIIASGSAAETDRRAAAIAVGAREALVSEPRWGVVVGVGEASESPAALPESYRQAVCAARVACALGRSQDFVRWSGLGAYRTIAALVGPGAAGAAIPESLKRVLASDEAETLTRTVECYLDLGGDARAAAEALYLHRSSLYGRLHRIEEVSGVDLHSGEDRLELHLGIRLWRLAGGNFDRA